jgi:hypothetical protein
MGPVPSSWVAALPASVSTPPAYTASTPTGRCPISTAIWIPPPPKPAPAASSSAAPSASATAGADAGPPPGQVTDASEVVKSAAPGFRRCYNKGLANDPGMTGSVRVGARIDAAGCVSAVAAMSREGLDDFVVQCVLDRVRRMEFTAPSEGGATIIIPVTFVSK